jgi:hypothetical protein
VRLRLVQELESDDVIDLVKSSDDGSESVDGSVLVEGSSVPVEEVGVMGSSAREGVEEGGEVGQLQRDESERKASRQDVERTCAPRDSASPTRRGDLEGVPAASSA